MPQGKAKLTNREARETIGKIKTKKCLAHCTTLLSNCLIFRKNTYKKNRFLLRAAHNGMISKLSWFYRSSYRSFYESLALKRKRDRRGRRCKSEGGEVRGQWIGWSPCPSHPSLYLLPLPLPVAPLSARFPLPYFSHLFSYKLVSNQNDPRALLYRLYLSYFSSCCTCGLSWWGTFLPHQITFVQQAGVELSISDAEHYCDGSDSFNVDLGERRLSTFQRSSNEKDNYPVSFHPTRVQSD